MFEKGGCEGGVCEKGGCEGEGVRRVGVMQKAVDLLCHNIERWSNDRTTQDLNGDIKWTVAAIIFIAAIS